MRLYIDFAKAVETVLDKPDMSNDEKASIVSRLVAIPAADVETKKRGSWVNDSDGIPMCSECEEAALQRLFFDTEKSLYDFRFVLSRRCPNCGAFLKGEENGNIDRTTD